MRFYVGKTTAILTATDDGSRRQALWGDWLEVAEPDRDREKYFVTWRNWNAKTRSYVDREFSIKKSDCRSTPLLEMIFIDVGQGDGCILAVPDGNDSKLMIIDAGIGTNVHRFLKWRRFNIDRNGRLHAAIITHPDQDHYRGFQAIFDDKEMSFDHVYHNGLIERAGDSKDNIGRREGGYCVDVYETHEAARDLLRDSGTRGESRYSRLLWTALSQPDRFGEVKMLGVDHDASGREFVPGFEDAGDPGKAAIEVLGPVVERRDGKARLREFGDTPRDGKFDKGKTKNGHSVLLRLTYGHLRIVFGGDLNRPSEDFLLRHYGGIGDAAPLADAIANARARFASDVLKCCHHGSADVTDEFLQTVSPFAFVVSSGDEESHVHPRPEVLGLLGKTGRTGRPLVLCTEILRSTPESRSLTKEEEATLRDLQAAIDAAPTADDRRKARRKEREFWDRRFRRLVNVYGAVNVRSDGEKIVVAFLKESGSATSRWHYYEYRSVRGEWVGGENRKSAH